MTDFSITDNAAKEISRLSKSHEAYVRLVVEGGGCSGFKYDFKFEKELKENDKIFEKNDAKLVIDDISLQFMSGTELDYVETMTSSEFQFKNPNASANCGCGQSFSI